MWASGCRQGAVRLDSKLPRGMCSVAWPAASVRMNQPGLGLLEEVAAHGRGWH